MLAGSLSAGDVLGLVGELGAGKTEFVRGLVEKLNVSARVRSPSFALLNTYDTDRFPVYHFDFFRLTDSSELSEIGFDEYVRSQGVCLVEWADMFPEVLPPQTRRIAFTDPGDGSRVIDMQEPG